MQSVQRPKRGDIVWVRLDPVEGAEQAGERPVLVVSPSVINEHSPVILIASITSKKTDRVYPFEVLIEPPEGGLKQRSKVLLLQLRSVDKRRLTREGGTLTSERMTQVDAAIRVATGLVHF